MTTTRQRLDIKASPLGAESRRPIALALAGFVMVAQVLLFGAPAHGVAENPKINADGVAVIIGNQDYADPLPDVRYASNDAEAMKAYVIDVLGFRPGNVIELTNATKAQLEAVFGNASSHEGRLNNWVRDGRSDVFIFYSGHGAPGLKDRRSYILPVDVDPELLEINGYGLDTLYGNLARINARHITLIMDACFSGLSPEGAVIKAASGLSIEPKRPDVAGDRFTIISAAADDQIASWDEARQQGLFTEYLLQALYGAADKPNFGNQDGAISLAEVQSYLNEEMTYAARRRFGRDQTAMIEGEGGLILATYDDGIFPDRPSRALSSDFTGTLIDALSQSRRVLTNANVRARPGTDSPRIARLQQGDIAKVTGQTMKRGDIWYRVNAGADGDGFVHGSLLGDSLVDQDIDQGLDPLANLDRESELAFWETVRDSNRVSEYQAYLNQYPDGQFSDLAKLRIDALSGSGNNARPAPPPPVQKAPPPRYPKVRVLTEKDKEGARLYRQFMGYAQDYYDEALKLERKADNASPARRKALYRAADLTRKMAAQKKDMAEGFGVGDHGKVRRAEQRYNDLNARREKIFARSLSSRALPQKSWLVTSRSAMPPRRPPPGRPIRWDGHR